MVFLVEAYCYRIHEYVQYAICSNLELAKQCMIDFMSEIDTKPHDFGPCRISKVPVNTLYLRCELVFTILPLSEIELIP